MEVARHAQSTQNRKLAIFLQLKEKILQLLLCSIVMQNIQIFYEVPVMFDVTCFWIVVVKNGCSVLDQGTLKSVYISQEWIDEMS